MIEYGLIYLEVDASTFEWRHSLDCFILSFASWPSSGDYCGFYRFALAVHRKYTLRAEAQEPGLVESRSRDGKQATGVKLIDCFLCLNFFPDLGRRLFFFFRCFKRVELFLKQVALTSVTQRDFVPRV